MKKTLSNLALSGAIIAAGCLIGAGAAHADTITLGWAVNGGSVTKLATGAGVSNFSGSVDGINFFIAELNGTGNPPLSGGNLLNSNNISLSSAGTTDTLDVYVTEQGITSFTGNTSFTSGFTENGATFPTGWTVGEYTYLDSANGLFATTTPLSQMSWTAIGSTTKTTGANAGMGPYSITAEYVIKTGGKSGSANSSINVSAAEPGTLALFGAGLLGCALFIGRRRRSMQDRA